MFSFVNYPLFVTIIGGSVFFLGILTGLILHIRKLYREYDRKMTLEEDKEKYLGMIRDAMKYFRDNYCNDFDNAIYENARINEDFIHKLILKRPLEMQSVYFKKLYERLYEMAYRIKEDKNDVTRIISPLKTLREELVREQLDYVRDMTREEEF